MTNYPALRAFISYIATFKKAFWFTAASFAVSDAVLMSIPWLVGQLASSLTNQTPQVTLWTTLLILASVGHDALWRISEVIYLKLLYSRGQRFDDRVFGAVIQHDYGYFIDKFTGKVSGYVNSIGREFRELLIETCYTYVNMIVSLPIIAITMFTVNVYTGVIFLACLLLMYLCGRNLAIRMADAERSEADKRSTVEGYIVDTIANFVSVKAFGNERREASRLAQRRIGLIDAANHAYVRAIFFWGVMSLFIRWIIWPSTFILNVYLFTHGRIDLAQMTTFLTVIVLFSSFVWDVIWNISQINLKLAKVEEAYAYLFGKRNIITEQLPDKPSMLSQDEFADSFELHNVDFAYPDKPDEPVLQHVQLNVKRGEKIGIVGPSGGGKSTLLKLLLGYYPLPEGSLLVDGKTADNRALTDLVAYVPQDTTIFHRSIRDNIAYAKPDSSDDEIIAAAKHAQAHDFIVKLDQGYDTLVGERGIKLSGGQRQRIAIARAILKDAPLLLLDEATSALDSESEKLIQRALNDLLQNRTALVIAHRLSTIQHMDRIVVFDDGQIVETGSHQQLLERKGLYAKLWAHQTDGFIPD